MRPTPRPASGDAAGSAPPASFSGFDVFDHLAAGAAQKAADRLLTRTPAGEQDPASVGIRTA